MFGIAIVAAFMALAAVLSSWISIGSDSATAMRTDNASAAVAMISSASLQYEREKGVFPDSIATLVATPGYEYIKPAASATSAHGYTASGNTLTDSIWTYQRVGAYTLKVSQGESRADYTASAKNTCGTGDLATGASWCGSKDSFWWRGESREHFAGDMIAERIRQQRLMQKIANYYNANQAFADPGGGSASFASLAGYAGTAANCSGAFQWNGIPLDCGDFFSVFGTVTYLNYLSANHVAILADSTIKDNSGVFINVATDMSLE